MEKNNSFDGDVVDNNERSLGKRIGDVLSSTFSFTARALSSTASVLNRIFFSKYTQIALTSIGVAQRGTSQQLVQNATVALRSAGVGTNVITAYPLLSQTTAAIGLATVFYGLGQALLWSVKKGYNALSSAISRTKPEDDNNNESDVDLSNNELNELPSAHHINLENSAVDDVLELTQASTFLPSQSAAAVKQEENSPVFENQVDANTASKPGLK